MAGEPDGHTLDATALVHEAYLKQGGESFASRTWFLRAAVSMRRILVDHARAKRADERGDGAGRVPAAHADIDLVALDDALDELARHDPTAAELVNLRYFCGSTHTEAADLLGLTRRQADGLWVVARAWLFRRLADG
jgi:RNA polymerase sigma factor (TIGR02999 family)